MQRSYFLGGSGRNGFETAFWDENRSAYGILLKGGPGTGKSTLMKKVAAAFSGEEMSLYHCASDPQSLDAVVLEERGVYLADATAPHEHSTPLPKVTGELVDLAQSLNADRICREEVLRLYAENRDAHAMAAKGIAGIAALEDMTEKIGLHALIPEKTDGFALRLSRKLLPKAQSDTGIIRERQITALTPAGKLTLCPPDWELILVFDPFYAASVRILRFIAEEARQNGLICEVSRSLTRKEHPITALLLPDVKTMLLSVQSAQYELLPEPVRIIKAERFYDRAVLRERRALSRFCIKSAASVTEQTTGILAEALRIHDALEKNYIAALDRSYLNRRTDEVIARIREFPRASQ